MNFKYLLLLNFIIISFNFFIIFILLKRKKEWIKAKKIPFDSYIELTNEIKSNRSLEIEFSNYTTLQTTPNFSLFVRLYSYSVMEYYNTLLISYLLFWPSKYWKNSDLVVVLDDESEMDHRMGTVLANLPPFPKVYFEKRPKDTLCSGFRGEGYSRQIYSSFQADKYTKAEFIGIVDSDVFFATEISIEDLFEHGKPRVYGHNGCCTGWMESLQESIGGDHAANFMIHIGFPFIVKREHFAEVRNHLTKQMKSKTFKEAFYKICSKYDKNRYDQYNLIFHYLWNYRRDQYSWHLKSFDHFSRKQSIYKKPVSETKDVINKNIPIVGLVKNGFHFKYPTESFNLIYDFLCLASFLEAGDCKKYSSPDILESTKENLFVNDLFRTPRWKERKMPNIVVNKYRLHEDSWNSKNLSWKQAYDIHIKNIRNRNYKKRWRKFLII